MRKFCLPSHRLRQRARALHTLAAYTSLLSVPSPPLICAVPCYATPRRAQAAMADASLQALEYLASKGLLEAGWQQQQPIGEHGEAEGACAMHCRDSCILYTAISDTAGARFLCLPPDSACRLRGCAGAIPAAPLTDGRLLSRALWQLIRAHPRPLMAAQMVPKGGGHQGTKLRAQRLQQLLTDVAIPRCLVMQVSNRSAGDNVCFAAALLNVAGCRRQV